MRPANGSVGMQGTVSERRRRDRERARTRNKRGEHQYPTTTLNEINVIITSPSQLRDWLEKRGTKKKTTNKIKETTLKEEGVQQLRSLRLPLLSASTTSNGSWEDLFRSFDLDCDGVVSEIDFALSILPYDHRMISLGHLHDFFFNSTAKYSRGGGGGKMLKTQNVVSSLYSTLDKIDGASGIVCGNDVLRWHRNASVSNVSVENIQMWWRDVIGDLYQGLSFSAFESIFWLPFKERVGVGKLTKRMKLHANETL